MTDGTNLPFNSSDKRHVDRFRSAVAGIVRNLLSAVDQAQPVLLSTSIRNQWWNDQNRPANRNMEFLLRDAAEKLHQFAKEFAGYLDSVPAFVDQDQPSKEVYIEQLRELTLLFADPGELEQAARNLRTRQTVDWGNLCRWDSLPDIRRNLDALPHSQKRGRSMQGVKITELETEKPMVIRYSGTAQEGVTPKIWKLLNYLLESDRNTTGIDDLVGTGKVWDDEVDDVHNADEWIRVDSLLRETRKFFRKNSVPFTVSRTKGLRHVFLKRIEQPEETESSASIRGKKVAKTTKPTNPSTKKVGKKKTKRGL